MRKVFSLVASGLVFSLLAFGSSVNATDAVSAVAPIAVVKDGIGGGTADQCCWTYFMGRWYCLPC
jgi:hypothetical protein